MIIYILGFTLTLLFARVYLSLERNNHRKSLSYVFLKNISFLFVILPFWLITAFRYDVGTDYLHTYVKYYEDVRMGWKPYSDYVFEWLNEILVKYNFDVVYLFAITGFIFLYFTFRIIFKYSDNTYLSIIVFFISSVFFASLNNVRQYVGIAIGIYALLEKNKVKSTILMFFSIGFHLSCMIFIPFLFIRNVNISKRLYKRVFCLLFCFLPMILYLFYLILLKTKYSYFLNNMSDGFSILYILLNLVIMFFSFVYYDKNNGKIQNCYYFQLVASILCICSMLFQNEELWMRVIRIFTYSQILLIPSFSKKTVFDKTCVITIICAFYLIYTVYTVIIKGGLDILPYKTIFN